MSKEVHRPGVAEANLVVRYLKLEGATPQSVESASQDILQIYGLDRISFDQSTLVVNLAYDASQIQLDGIEDVLSKHGLEIGHDWWTQIKEGYYHFVDENVNDNAHIVAHSCNKIPTSANRKK